MHVKGGDQKVVHSMELSDLFLSGEVKFNERRKGMETSRTQHGLPTS